MSTPTPDEDDRTVIRPLSQAAPAVDIVPSDMTELQPEAPPPADDAPTQLQTQRMPANERTQQVAPPASLSRHEHGNALPVGTSLGEFEITGVLGEGGFGIVYLAQDHSLQRRVALKEYMPSALAARSGLHTVSVKSERHRETFELGLKSFVNEARLLAQFDHPSLVKVYRFWEANGTAYMVMPFYEGITLRDKLREMPAPPDEAWLMGLMAPLTEALQVIHAEHCYHRDIAPDNIILLAGSGRPLLLDFGAARRVIGDMTQALTVILKPGYAPLEQYAEVPGMKQGPWTDVYALAAVMYFAVTRKTPPPAVGRMLSDTCVPLADAAAGRYSDRFLLAIDRALKVRPEERTQSIEALREDLELGGGGAAAREAAATAPAAPARAGVAAAPQTTSAVPQRAAASSAPAKTAGLPGWAIGAGLAGLLVVAGGAYWALTPHGAPKQTPAAASPAAANGAAPAGGGAADVSSAGASAPAVVAAAPAAAPAPVPVPVPTPFTMTGEFDRALQGQTPGFDVQAHATRATLRIDRDRLGFTVSAARDGYVYVIAHDPDGSTTLLFPNSQASQNRIRAGQTLTLPQPSWPVVPTEPEGQEHFLVIVSQSPRDFGAVGTQRESWFLKLASGDAAAALAREHAGGGSVMTGKAACSEPGCDAYGAARFSVQIVR